MNKKAYVKEIINEKALLSVKRECMCAGKDNCTTKCFTLQNEIIEIMLNNEIGAKTGDFVEVEGNSSAILLYSVVIFIAPVFTGLLLYFISRVFTENIILPYIISGAGFILSVFVLYFIMNNVAKNKNDFKITKIL